MHYTKKNKITGTILKIEDGTCADFKEHPLVKWCLANYQWEESTIALKVTVSANMPFTMTFVYFKDNVAKAKESFHEGENIVLRLNDKGFYELPPL